MFWVVASGQVFCVLTQKAVPIVVWMVVEALSFLGRFQYNNIVFTTNYNINDIIIGYESNVGVF